MKPIVPAILAAMFALSAPVLAQDSGEDTANVIDEIITTATRREENVQDISIAVTALDGNALKQGGIEDISRL